MQTLFSQPATTPPMPLRVRRTPARENVSASFIVALTVHVAIIGGAAAWALYVNVHSSAWGEHSLQSGSISATMVPSIPLPSKVPVNPNHVLATENPSIAPTPPKEKAAPPPKPNEVLIPDKVVKPPKIAEKPAPTPPRHVEVTPPDPKKIPVGDGSGTRIPEAIQHQIKNGTASVTVDDRSFGQRYAYYARIVDQKVSDSWNAQQIFPGAATGMHAVVVFTINADGTPSDVHIVTKSGSAPFDVLALRTIQRIDGFGPLPQTKPITVEFALDYKAP